MEDNDTVVSWFLTKRFDGNKTLTRQLLEEIERVISSECGVFGVNYAFPRDPDTQMPTEWPIDAHGVPQYHRDYCTVVVPDPLGDNATADAALKREQLRKIRREENQTIETMFTKVKKIVERRCDAAINLELCTGVRKHHPFLWIKYLRDTYGATNATVQEKGNVFIGLLGECMKPSEKFNSAYIHWCKKADDAELTDSQKVGILLARRTDNNNKLGVQFLPDRLSDVIKYCRTNAHWNLAECVRHIREADDVSQRFGDDKRSVKAVKKDEGRPCWNCRNYGHSSYDCLSAWCGYCLKANCGHKAHDCPLRLQSNDQKKRHRDESKDEDRDDYEEKVVKKDDYSHRGGRGKRGGRGRGRGHGDYIGGQKVVSVSYQSDDEGDDDSDCEEAIYLPECHYNSHRPSNTRPIRPVKSVVSDNMDIDFDQYDETYSNMPVRKLTSKSKPKIDYDGNLEFDTGSSEWLFKKPKLLDEVRPFFEPGTKLLDASGNEMKVSHVGNFKFMTDRALVSDDLNCEGLISGPRVQEAGFSVFLPAWTPDHDIGVIIYDDKDSKVVAVGNREMKIDPNTIGKHKQHIVKPDISKIIRCVRVKTVQPIYGLSPRSVGDIVQYLQSCFHFTVKDMEFLCSTIDNFPVNADQVRKYYVQDVNYIKGHLQHRKVDYKQFLAPADKRSKSRPHVVSIPEDDINPDTVEVRNLVPGYQVGIDFFGPVSNISMLASVDKATGYRVSADMRHSKRAIVADDIVTSKKNVVDHLRYIFKEYEKYGHHSHDWRGPIKEIIADSDPVFRSKAVRELLRDETVTPKYSPPGVHQLNGLAENRNRGSLEQVISMWSAARWMPESTFAFCWKLADLLLNLKPSRRQGYTHLSRFQDFRNIRPNWKELCILPWGCPVEAKFQVTVGSGTSAKLVDKSVTGAYLMPDVDSTNGAIYVWNFQTKKKFVAYSYRILDDVPTAFRQLEAAYRGVEFLLPTSGLPTIIEEGVTTEDDDEPADTPSVPAGATYPSCNPVVIASSAAPSTSEPVMVDELNVSSPVSVSEGVNPVISVSEGDDRAVQSLSGSSEGSAADVSETGDVVPVSPTVDVNAGIPEVQPNPPVISRPRRHAVGALPWKTKYQSSEGGSGGVLKLHSYHDCEFDMSNSGLMGQTLERVRCLMYTKYTSSKKGKYRAKRHEYLQRVHVVKWLKTSAKVRKVTRKQHREDNPTNAQVMKRPDKHMFMKAREEELHQLGRHGEYAFDTDRPVKVEELPKGATVFNSMFVDVIKRNASTREIDKYKSRLVVLGNQQAENTYDKIKSGTARGSSVKLLIAIQAKLRAKSMVLDVKGAFLKSAIDDPERTKFYLRLPDGKIVLLRKYLYGLKQAGYQWMVNVTTALLHGGYRQTADPLVFTKQQGDDFIHMSLHVDDFYVISNCDKLLDDLEKYLKGLYGEITRKSGDTVEYLGLSIRKDHATGNITISQPGYIDKMLKVMKMDTATGCSTPMSASPYTPKDDDDTLVDKISYLEAVGNINYLAIFSRPDLLYSLSRAAQLCSSPTQKAMRQVKRIFRNIKNTKDWGITFKADDDLQLVAYADASYNCYPDGKSHQGYALSLGHGNGSFMAKSGKIKLVAQSSSEAEYVALCNCTKEVVFIRRLLNDLGVKQRGPTVIYEDNMSTIKMVNGGMSHDASKHINPKFHYTRDMIEQKVVKVVHMNTKQMIADVLTKPLFEDDHVRLASVLLNRANCVVG